MGRKRKFFSWRNRWNVPVLMNLVILLSMILIWQNITFYKAMRNVIEGQYKGDVEKIISTEVIRGLELQVSIIEADRNMYRELWVYTATENKEIKTALSEKISPLLQPYGCELYWIGGEPLIKRGPMPEKINMEIGVLR